MAKNSVVVRTAQDLEAKYNFASLLGLKKNVEITAQGIQKIENELNNMLNALVINLKDVLDSQSEISLWFYSGKPTTSNEPYISWEMKDEHIGDIYYDRSTGYVYQWNGVWEVNTSPDLIEAMAITNAEIDTQDHERKVFFDTPTIPYSNGDWWIKENGELFICQISKKSGSFENNDFINSSEYTESIAEKIGEEIKVLKGTITLISENYAKFTDLATGGSTIIAGENISTGNIQSNNFIKDVSGTKLSLSNGQIEIYEEGNAEEGSSFEDALFKIKNTIITDEHMKTTNSSAVTSMGLSTSVTQYYDNDEGTEIHSARYDTLGMYSDYSYYHEDTDGNIDESAYSSLSISPMGSFDEETEGILPAIYLNSNLLGEYESLEISSKGIRHSSKYFGYESGSNENGEWMKFDDGTLICRGKITVESVDVTEPDGALYRSSSIRPFKNFPQKFIEEPSVHIEYINSTDYRRIWFTKTEIPSITNVKNVILYSATSATVKNVILTYQAIGKWK